MRLACGIAAYYVLFHGIAADSFAALPLLFSRECVRGILPFVFRGIFEALPLLFCSLFLATKCGR